MPELPEVETVKRTVEPKITGQIITDIDVRNDAVLENVSSDFFYTISTRKLCGFHVTSREVPDFPYESRR